MLERYRRQRRLPILVLVALYGLLSVVPSPRLITAQTPTIRGSWQPLGDGVVTRRPNNPDVAGVVYVSLVVGNDLYIGGSFTHAGGIQARNLARWDGTSWHAVGDATSPFANVPVYALAVLGDHLYVGGTKGSSRTAALTSIEGALARWSLSEQSWSTIGFEKMSVVGMAVIGFNLYIVGAKDSLFTLLIWNATTARMSSPLLTFRDIPAFGFGSPFQVLAVSGTDLFIGGIFKDILSDGRYVVQSNPFNSITRLDTTTNTFYNLGTGLTDDGGSRGEVYSLAIQGSYLYVGGSFSKAGGASAPTLARWDMINRTWSAVGNGTHPGVVALAVDGSQVFAGGYHRPDAVSNLAMWDGSQWSALTGSTGTSIGTLAVAPRGLYVGGYFSQVGGIQANGIARWIPQALSGSSMISGRVTDGATPLADVVVEISGGRRVVTGSTGEYQISDLPAGTYTVTPTFALQAGQFQPLSRVVTLPPDGTGQDFVFQRQLAPLRVTPRYGTFFFNLPGLPEAFAQYQFTIEVDETLPQGTELVVRFNDKVQVVPYEGKAVDISLSLDQARPGLNDITVLARNMNGASPPIPVEFIVRSTWPDWIGKIANGPTRGTVLDKELRWRVEARFPSSDETLCSEEVVVPAWVPFLGGELDIPRPQLKGAFEATSRKQFAATFEGKACFAHRPPGGRPREITGTAIGKLSGDINTQSGVTFDVREGSFSFSVTSAFTGSAKLLDLVPQSSKLLENRIVGPVLRTINNTTRLTGFIGVKAATTGNLEVRYDELTLVSATPEMGLTAQAKASIKVGDVLRVTAQGVGGLTATLQFPAEPAYVKEVKAEIDGKLEVKAWHFSFGGRGICRYSSQSSETGCFEAGLTAPTDWSITPRTYVSPSYSQFIASASAPGQSARLASAVDRLIQQVYPQAEPALAVWGSGAQTRAVAVWVQDDPAKPEGQGTELYASQYRDGTWHAPDRLTDDVIPDFDPRLITDGHGHLLLVWTRIPGATSADSLDTAFTRKVELASSVYTIAADTWTQPTLLTENTALDVGAHLATNGQQVLLTWRQNGDGFLESSAAMPTQIMARFWDGSKWSMPTSVSSSADSSTSAMKLGAKPLVAFVRTTSLQTQELYTSTWDGTAWSTPVRVASSSSIGGVRAAYAATDEPLLVWYDGSRLMSQVGDLQKLIMAEEITGFQDTRLLVDQSGNALIVYQGMSSEGPDLFTIVYNGKAGRWGSSTQLTATADLETALAPVVDDSGQLWTALVTITSQNSLSTAEISHLDILQAPILWELPSERTKVFLPLIRR